MMDRNWKEAAEELAMRKDLTHAYCPEGLYEVTQAFLAFRDYQDPDQAVNAVWASWGFSVMDLEPDRAAMNRMAAYVSFTGF